MIHTLLSVTRKHFSSSSQSFAVESLERFVATAFILIYISSLNVSQLTGVSSAAVGRLIWILPRSTSSYNHEHILGIIIAIYQYINSFIYRYINDLFLLDNSSSLHAHCPRIFFKIIYKC